FDGFSGFTRTFFLSAATASVASVFDLRLAPCQPQLLPAPPAMPSMLLRLTTLVLSRPVAESPSALAYLPLPLIRSQFSFFPSPGRPRIRTRCQRALRRLPCSSSVRLPSA